MGFREQIQTVKRHDPAMKSGAEIILYPSFWAVGFHRAAHWLYGKKLFWLARFISQVSRGLTGIEIHPGAEIGKGLFIDHGMGVVIGETCSVGDGVTIYQGVTLGGTGKERGKRHPTIGDNVVIGAGAKVLGPFTVGARSHIGAGSVVLQEIPECCTVVGIPGRIVKRDGQKATPSEELDHVRMPDPVSMEFCRLRARIDELEKKIEEKNQ
ncbi:MAG: serine O-acetyltransferase [Clostridiales bacterium]|jgi:serine O-acetyltransferase|nr:serine O-acetyltransferase [Clostridiales bacterium]